MNMMSNEEITTTLQAQIKFNTDMSRHMVEVVEECQKMENRIDTLEAQIKLQGQMIVMYQTAIDAVSNKIGKALKVVEDEK